MLCISVKEEERVAVGDFVIVVRKARGGYASLGFDGPKDTPVTRQNAKTKGPKPCATTK